MDRLKRHRGGLKADKHAVEHYVAYADGEPSLPTPNRALPTTPRSSTPNRALPTGCPPAAAHPANRAVAHAARCWCAEAGAAHRAYYPTPWMLAKRLQLATALGTGVSIWEIGQGLPYFYSLL